MKRIRDLNIRATADERFWGTGCKDSVFVWEFSKHRLPLSAFAEQKTLGDPYQAGGAVKQAHDACRGYYYKYVKLLAKKLNEIHGVDYPDMFWRIAFGSWLYRHIAVAYDKYLTLQVLDVDRTSIILLSTSSFFIPNDHFEYMYCFGGDHGTMQLTSQYYSVFAREEFHCVECAYHLEAERKKWTNHHNHVLIHGLNGTDGCATPGTPRGHGKYGVALCSAYYPEWIIAELCRQSNNRIYNLSLPPVVVQAVEDHSESRLSLARGGAEDRFEEYLNVTLSCCMPKIFVEYFNGYRTEYERALSVESDKAIVTECWDSFSPVTLYCALAKQMNGTRLILQEHGASLHMLDYNVQWIEEEVSDAFITTGYDTRSGNGVKGGFITREQHEYTFAAEKTNVLHVATTRFPYFMAWSSGMAGVGFLNYIRDVDDMITMIPPRLKDCYVLRPRREGLLVDTERLWETRKRNVRVEVKDDFLQQLLQAKIVIIDHISTGFAEILVNKIPFLLLFTEGFFKLSEEYLPVFEGLAACGVMHTSPETLAGHLDKVYDDVEGWWSSPHVQKAVGRLIGASLGPATATMDYLISLSRK